MRPPTFSRCCLKSSAGLLLALGFMPLFGAQAFATDHLYVVAGTVHHRATTLLRYPLLGNGLPASSPDLQIANAGPGIAVAADGTLAALRQGTRDIDFFSPGATTPERTLQLHSLMGCPIVSVFSMVFDAANHLFVSYAYVGESCSVTGTFAFAPGASGNAKPLQNLRQSGALAIDATGSLYISSSRSIAVITNAATQPVVARTIKGAFTLGGGIAIVPPTTRLWRYTITTFTPNVLAEYYGQQDGPQDPLLGIFTETPDLAFRGFVAYWDGRLYATYGGRSGYGLNVFNEIDEGLSIPLAQLSAPRLGFEDLAVGP